MMRLAFVLACAVLAIPAEMEGPTFRSARIGRSEDRPLQKSGRLAGIVVDTSTPPQPVRRAIVMLASPDLPRAQTTITDDEGAFAFDRLPAGRFTITATKPAHLPGAHGATRPGRPGVPLQLADGESVTNVRITMSRGGALAGTIRDPSGESVPDLQVAAFRMPVPGAAMQTVAAAAVALTDDRGAYRLYGLPPGTYVIATTMRLGGRTPDIAVLSPAAIDQAFRELQERSGSAATPAARPGPGAMPPGSYDLAPVFFPGVSAVAAATPIRIGLGEEKSGIDFPVQFTRMATIRGVLNYPAGPPPMVQFAIRTDGLRLPSLVGSVPAFSSVAGPTSRAFTYTNVAPGRYAITVRTRSEEPMWARADVEITGTDVSDLVLNLQPSFRVSGRVVFEGTSPRPDATTIQVSLSAANGAGSGGSGTTQLGNLSVPVAMVDDDLQFELAGVLPETYVLATSLPASSGWWLRSAIVGGRDILDYPFQIGSSLTGVVLTYSDRRTTLSGTLLKTTGEIAPAYFVAVFPADRSLWRPESRRTQSARSGTDGRWIVKGLPPGEYLVAALTDLDPDDLLDSTFLETLAAAAVKVSLGEGEEKVQNLRIGG